MKIYSIHNKAFETYGKIITRVDVEELIKKAEQLSQILDGSKYVASIQEYEETKIGDKLYRELFGEIPTQIGLCYGRNDTLNALEWHKSSEINIAVTDFILLLGNIKGLEGKRYNSKKLKAFKVNKGDVIEIFAGTMHFCPIEVNENGFKCIVALPQGTNIPLEKKSQDELLFKKNKWLICHEDNAVLKSKDVYPGLYGKNYKL